MIDPLLTLALALHASPGIYALLLGSGVSQTAGIPTGWQVVLNLVRRVAAAAGESTACAPDPLAWYRMRFGSDPTYTTLLDQVAPTPAERQRLLRRYFDPAAEEHASGAPGMAGELNAEMPGRGRPTPAHHAIAALCVTGHLRLIMTTNFDTLLETALAASNVPHTVLSTPDDVEGAIPLVHGGVIVVKLHGDYRDARILNTREELAVYDPRLKRLLSRVLDEFGLVVCGWSGEEDVALRNAIARTRTHRFTTFWAARSEPSLTAARLIRLRRAQVIQISDADDFFVNVADRVRALATIDAPHPLSALAVAAMLKRHMAGEEGRIRVHDLAVGAADTVREGAFADRRRLEQTPDTPQAVGEQIARLDARAETFIRVMTTGCYWGTDSHAAVWIKALGRASDVSEAVMGSSHGGNTWNDLRYYPALLGLYAGAMAAIAASQWRLVAALLTRPVNRIGHSPAALLLNTAAILNLESQRRYLGQANLLTPMSEHVFRVLREPLREVYTEARDYEPAFDYFEYLLALLCADLSREADPTAAPQVPLGRFRRSISAGNTTFAIEEQVQHTVTQEIESAGSAWPPLAAGLFGGFMDRVSRALAAVRERVQSSAVG